MPGRPGSWAPRPSEAVSCRGPVRLGIVQFRLERLDAGIDGIELQGQLVVDDDGDHVAGLDGAAFLHLQRDDGAANAGAGGNHVAAFDLAEDRLEFWPFNDLYGNFCR